MSGSGTGGVDGALRAIAQWGRDPLLAASVRYTRVGAPARGDRRITVDAQGRAAAVDDRRSTCRTGSRRAWARGARSGRGLAVVLEASAAFDVGGRTPTVDESWPLDVLAGLQARWGGPASRPDCGTTATPCRRASGAFPPSRG